MKVRYNVESEHTSPNKRCWEPKNSTSAQHSPPPASINMASAQHLATVMDRRPWTLPANRRRQRLAHLQPVSERPQRMQPNMAHHL